MSALKHGTITAYRNHGCRCDECRAVQREYVYRNRRARAAEGRLNHGTRSAYDAGCRCDDCRLNRMIAYYKNHEWKGLTTRPSALIRSVAS
jgi:hypothetical protein